jgi:hypothetical protein
VVNPALTTALLGGDHQGGDAVLKPTFGREGVAAMVTYAADPGLQLESGSRQTRHGLAGFASVHARIQGFVEPGGSDR